MGGESLISSGGAALLLKSAQVSGLSKELSRALRSVAADAISARSGQDGAGSTGPVLVDLDATLIGAHGCATAAVARPPVQDALAKLEVRRQLRARAGDRIRGLKDTGLARPARAADHQRPPPHPPLVQTMALGRQVTSGHQRLRLSAHDPTNEPSHPV